MPAKYRASYFATGYVLSANITICHLMERIFNAVFNIFSFEHANISYLSDVVHERIVIKSCDLQIRVSEQETPEIWIKIFLSQPGWLGFFLFSVRTIVNTKIWSVYFGQSSERYGWLYKEIPAKYARQDLSARSAVSLRNGFSTRVISRYFKIFQDKPPSNKQKPLSLFMTNG